MMLAQALQYPLRGKRSLRCILILALLQLLPIVGQLILIGYGFDIVRAVYAEQTELPSLRWLPALRNGLRFFLAGLGYLLPILITIGIVVGTLVGGNSIGSKNTFGNLGIISILVAMSLPLLVFLIRAFVVKRINSTPTRPPQARRSGLRIFMNGLLPVIVMILVTLTLSTLVSLSGIRTGHPNGLSILLFVLFALLIFLIGIILYIGGVRYALENRGLLAPMTNARLLLKNHTLTRMLLLNVILLGALTVLGTIVGLVLFILPGVFVFVIGSLSVWYLFARYSRSIDIPTPGLPVAKSPAAIF